MQTTITLKRQCEYEGEQQQTKKLKTSPFFKRTIIDLKDEKSGCWYQNEWLSKFKADELLTKVKTLKLEANPKCMIFSKECTMHRSVGFFSNECNEYKYTGQSSKAETSPDWLEELIEKVNFSLNTKFNAVLINYYKDGSDYISAHSDKKDELFNGTVACISLGSPRTFQIISKDLIDGHKLDIGIQTGHGQLLVMEKEMQTYFKHGIPKSNTLVGPRYSLTFRCHKKTK